MDLYPLFAIAVIAALILILFGPDHLRKKLKETSESVFSESALNATDAHIPVSFNPENLPEYSGEPFEVVNDNKPFFTEEEITSESFEYYGELDALGRCTVAFGCYGLETVPPSGDQRGDISSVHPTGYRQKTYSCIDDGDPERDEPGCLYNRCHLAAWCISDEDANERNLITGTRYMNVDGMWQAESQIQDYIYQSNCGHVMYRVTPVFRGNNLLCDGLLMEAYSVEDNGRSVQFCVFCFNVQPGIDIDYRTGESRYSGEFLDKDASTVILN